MKLEYRTDNYGQEGLYSVDGNHQVMMEWEREYMNKCIEVLEPYGNVLEIGFGMAYSADKIQSYNIKSHTIIECNPLVLKRLEEYKKTHPNVIIVQGRWQDVLESCGKFDCVFFDDYPVEDKNDRTRFLKFLMDVLNNHSKKNTRISLYSATNCNYLKNFTNIDLIVNEFKVDIPEHCKYAKGDTMYTVLIKKKYILQEKLIELVDEPYNPLKNFNLALEYHKINQTAIAVSYYLRCAEFTENKIFSSEALLRASLCVNTQQGRDEKELYLIKHAITASPNSIEPYYIASLFYSWRSGNIPEKKFWLDSYQYACLGINIIENGSKSEPFITNFGYTEYNIYFQKAFAGSNIGKINEAQEIYTKILSTYELDSNTKNIILEKKNKLPEPNHPIIPYSRNNLDNLKLIFNNSDKIDVNYSQIYQDMYVLSMHNGKMNGTYLEIGAGDYKYGNNTYLLEREFNWIGISIDFNKNFVNNFNKNRKNKCICNDATTIDYLELLSTNYTSTNIDYLQLDCDPPNITFDILNKIPFDKYKFGVITYEHDFYNDNTGSYREKSRRFLKDKGYKLIAGNISPYSDKCPFEDWWIHPDLIDENIWKLFEKEDDESINGVKYMLTKSKYIQEAIFEISNKLTTINNYHKNTPATFKLFKKCNVCDCIRRGYRWEEHQHDIIDKYLDEKSIVIEAGSHIGTIAVKLAKTCGLTYCFEPVINTYSLLEFNMNKNCISNKFKLFNKGLGERIKTENISWISNEGSGGIGITNNFFEPAKQRDKTETIEIITIDSLNLDRLDYIKIDIEGYEEHVIIGGIDTIKKHKPIIVLECYETFSPLKPASLEYVKNKYNLLLNLGYKIQHIWNADFLFIPIKKIQQKAIITFGTDYLFKNQKIRFKQQARDINFFDSIIIEDEKTIKPLLKEHEEFIINNKRGYGYWIWKPIIIKNQLEKMKDNDILFYLDCGSTIINNNTDNLNTYIDILKDKDIMVFYADYLSKKFIKKNVINEFNLNKDVLDNNLIEAGCVIIKKTDFSFKFLNLWLDTMTKNNYSLVNDDLLNHEQDKEFIEHRHDQSILTILARQYDNVYINNGVRELYNTGPIFHSRLTDQGQRQYAKSIPIINNPNEYSEISNDAKIYDNITKKINPNIIVIDNFYTNPDKIREYALSLTYEPPENHGAVGYRCESGRKILDGTKELLEKILHANIPNGNKEGEWNYSTNGCFQWCNASVPIVYHCDSQKYAAIIYLTPNAPPECGTSFLRHKKYKLRNSEVFSKSDWYQSDLNYKEPHLDKTQWEVVDSIGNVYNRLVIFDAQYIHGVSEYFGEDIHNSRLFQLFFFDITK